ANLLRGVLAREPCRLGDSANWRLNLGLMLSFSWIARRLGVQGEAKRSNLDRSRTISLFVFSSPVFRCRLRLLMALMRRCLKTGKRANRSRPRGELCATI